MKIFISHSSIDKPFARKLRRDLTACGYDVWMDEKNIHIGCNITTGIQDGLIESKFVILVVSPESISSGWVEAEWTTIFASQVTKGEAVLLPLVRKKAHLPLFLQNLLYADASNNYALALAKIIQAIERVKESSEQAVIFPHQGAVPHHYTLPQLLCQQNQDVVFCGFTHGSTLFSYDDKQIAEWVSLSRSFEIFIAKPEHSNQDEWLPRIKFYKKKFSYNQLDGVIERCKNVRDLLAKKNKSKLTVYLLDLQRVNLLNVKKIGGLYIQRIIGFAQMGTISPILITKETSEVGKFFCEYLANLRKFNEFWETLPN